MKGNKIKLLKFKLNLISKFFFTFNNLMFKSECIQELLFQHNKDHSETKNYIHSYVKMCKDKCNVQLSVIENFKNLDQENAQDSTTYQSKEYYN